MYIVVNSVEGPDSVFAYNVDVQLQEGVCVLRSAPGLVYGATTWASGGVGRVGEAKFEETVRSSVRDFVDKFANDYLAQNGAAGQETTSESDTSGHGNILPVVTTATGNFVRLPDGLKYKVLIAGQGTVATAGHTLTVDYTGRLTNGTVFDASARHGSPFKFLLGGGQVIRGWDEGIDGMKVGEKRELIIPPSLGYGTDGAGQIPPNSTLVFVVTLDGVD